MKYILRFISLSTVISFLFLSACVGLPKSAGENSTVNLLTYNVRNCKGMDDVINFDRVAAVINKAGVECVAIQELDSGTQRANGLSVLHELAKRTNMIPTYRSSIDYQGGKYGIGMLTKEKPLSVQSFSLPGREEKRSFLVVEMRNYIFCCTHLSLTPADQLTSIGIINNELSNFKNKPVILAGDLNAEPQSEELIKFTENWQILNDTSIQTFPADKPNRCIDYFLVKKGLDFTVKTVKTSVIDEQMASDHRPVYLKVKIVAKKSSFTNQ